MARNDYTALLVPKIKQANKKKITTDEDYDYNLCY